MSDKHIDYDKIWNLYERDLKGCGCDYTKGRFDWLVDASGKGTNKKEFIQIFLYDHSAWCKHNPTKSRVGSSGFFDNRYA